MKMESTNKSTSKRRRLIGALSVTAIVAAGVLTASPALADEYGYVNCYPNYAPYKTVHTQSHSSGTTGHIQRNGNSSAAKSFSNGITLQTRVWNNNWTVNSSSTIAGGIWLYSTARYCA